MLVTSQILSPANRATEAMSPMGLKSAKGAQHLLPRVTLCASRLAIERKRKGNAAFALADLPSRHGLSGPVK
jgi:hypothetical protein